MTVANEDVEQGKVLEVSTEATGSTLAGDYAIGASVLKVNDTSDFADDGGSVQIGEEEYAYSTRDITAETITLSSPLTVAASYDDPVFTLPLGEEKWCLVNLYSDEDAISARVPHHLYDKMKVGVRSPADWETVLVAIDGTGDWVIQDIIGAIPKTDASTLDPETVTVIPGVPDGVPPAYSPVPRLIPALGAIVVTFTQVPNHDPVMYDIYLSTDPSCPVVEANLATDAMSGATVFLREVPATATPLVIGESYYIRTHAHDFDGYADPSDVYDVTITADIDALMGITETHIDELSVSSPLFQGIVGQFVILQAGIITADEAFIEAINGVTFTGTLFQTHNDPFQGVKMAASFPEAAGGGLVGYGGSDITFLLDADTGHLDAYDATIHGTFRTGAGADRVQIDWNSVDVYGGSENPGFFKGGLNSIHISSPYDDDQTATELYLYSGDHGGGEGYAQFTTKVLVSGYMSVSGYLEAYGMLLAYDSVRFEDLSTTGDSVDAGARYCRVGDDGRLYASVNPPGSLSSELSSIWDAISDHEGRIDFLETRDHTH